LKQFYNNEIKPVHFNTAIIGKKEKSEYGSGKQNGNLYRSKPEDIFGH
jgi:hypothetical protein